jgi:hypothetical protein
MLMIPFQDYNLIDLVNHLAFDVMPGKEIEYLSKLPAAVKKAVLDNYEAITNARIPQMSAQEESELLERTDGHHPSGF